MKNRIMVIFGLLVWLGTAVSAESVRFDELGKMIPPDKLNLEKGMEAQALGYENDAMRYLTKSAKFGNSHAMAVIGFLHLKKKDYVKALAWLNLIDLNMIPNDEMLLKLRQGLEANLSESETLKSKQINAELQETYSKHATLLHREKWKKSLKFGGSRIRGHVPSDLTIHISGEVNLRYFNSERAMATNSGGISLNAFQVKHQLHEFTYEYEHQFMHGDVKLQDIELFEEEKQI